MTLFQTFSTANKTEESGILEEILTEEVIISSNNISLYFYCKNFETNKSGVLSFKTVKVY